MRTTKSSISPKLPAVDHPLRIGGKLPDRLDIGGEPGQAVGGALLAVEHARHRAALDRDPGGDGAAGIGKQRLGGGNRLVERGDQVLAGGHGGCGKRHGKGSFPSRPAPLAGEG